MSQSPRPIRALLVSDLHIFPRSEEGKSPSFVGTQDETTLEPRQPVNAMFKLILEMKRDGVLPEIDLVLCPGDLGDRANAAGIAKGWAVVNELGRVVDAEVVAATVGNHDVASRDGGADAFGALKALVPPFPCRDYEDAKKYWTESFCILEKSRFRLVVLNSSFAHGSGTTEYQHGRVDDKTIDDLEERLKHASGEKANILLTHHHPHKHSEVNLGDYDEMVNGQELLAKLEKLGLGRWLVVHGHKHHPKLSYASGGANSPVVFSAGSLSAQLYAELATVCRNQMYLLELHEDGARSTFVGRFRAWHWSQLEGWIPARSSTGLPAEGGFGLILDIPTLAASIKEKFQPPFMTWEALVAEFRDLQFLIPSDIELLQSHLEGHSMRLVMDQFGKPFQLGGA